MVWNEPSAGPVRFRPGGLDDLAAHHLDVVDRGITRDAVSYTHLLLNLSANGVVGAEVHQMALSDKPGMFAYSRSGANGVVSIFGGDPRELINHDLVPASTLDRELAGRPVNAIKIDVEGAEGLVLFGGRSTLESNAPTIVFEFSPPALESVSKMGGRDVLGLLIELGYSIDVIGGPDAGPANKSAQQVMDRYEGAPEGDVYKRQALSGPRPRRHRTHRWPPSAERG